MVSESSDQIVCLFNSAKNFYPTFTSTIDRATPKPGGISIASQSELMEATFIWFLTKEDLELDIG